MKRAVLCCNGLDKPEGVLARQLAILLSESEGIEIICPVLSNNSPTRYEKVLADASVLVIDGCPTRCASKLASKLGAKISDKVLISERVKSLQTDIGKSLRPNSAGIQLVETICSELKAPTDKASADESAEFLPPSQFLTVTHDKYIFKIPAEGYLFSENEFWVRVIGSRARIGVTDYMQQNLTDITFFEPAKIGAEIDQFDEVGAIESAKSMVDVLSPVSGTIIAVNTALENNPEFVNEDPYDRGWVAEIELTTFDVDKELLLGPEAYSKVVERKAAGATA